MNKSTRIIIAATLALGFAAGGGLAGYSAGHNSAEQGIKTTQCAAIEGLDLTPMAGHNAPTPSCVWAYQVSLSEALQRGVDQCWCS